MRLTASLSALTLAAALSGCGGGDPCAGVAENAPPEAKKLMQQGYEVSKDVDEDLECELQMNGSWVLDA